MACSGRWLTPLIKQMAHTFRDVRAVVQLAQLPHAIKYACSVWLVYFCFLVMAGPSGSSEVNKTMSFDKHTLQPHAHTLPGACDSSASTFLVFESPWRDATIYSPPHIHTRTLILMHASVCIIRPLLQSLKLLVLVVTFSLSPNDSHSTPG